MIDLPPYSISQNEKSKLLLKELIDLTAFHYAHCKPYKNILDAHYGGLKIKQYLQIEDIPFLPVSILKTKELISIPKDQICNVITSSGTTSGNKSKVFLDKNTARQQSIVLVKIMQHFLGKQRLPVLFIDHPDIIKDPKEIAARGAGVRGMMQFGRKVYFLLNKNMEINQEVLEDFLENHTDQEVLIFGFTYMVWQHFVQALIKSGKMINLPNAVLMHSGGWKKLETAAVSHQEFERQITKVTQISKIHNFYGMAEQVGTVFVENSLHLLHTPTYAEVIIRDPITYQPLPIGKEGLVQVLSLIPKSYPGHSLLTEDIGVIHDQDSHKIEMKGRYFSIKSRLPKAELRGCSDTFKEEHEYSSK